MAHAVVPTEADAGKAGRRWFGKVAMGLHDRIKSSNGNGNGNGASATARGALDHGGRRRLRAIRARSIRTPS